MQLHTINTGNFKLDGGAMYGVVPKVIWNKLNPADENNLCSWAMRCLLVEETNRLVLIDTGIGNKQSEKFFSHYHLHGEESLERSLATRGFSRHDITDVFLTHLHFDHCGGAIVNDGGIHKTAFPNATYWSNEKHWDWACSPNDREKASFLKENILPIRESGQLKFIDIKDEASLFPGFDILFANGHTQSMMLPVLSYKGSTIVYMADLLPSVSHIPIPYIMAYDMFPMTTLKEKQTFLETAFENNYILYFEHDTRHECCTLRRTERGIREDRVFSLSEFD